MKWDLSYCSRRRAFPTVSQNSCKAISKHLSDLLFCSWCNLSNVHPSSLNVDNTESLPGLNPAYNCHQWMILELSRVPLLLWTSWGISETWTEGQNAGFIPCWERGSRDPSLSLLWMHENCSNLCGVFWFCFSGSRVWTQGFTLVRLALYCWAHHRENF
jgi:hypothetical protein